MVGRLFDDQDPKEGKGKDDGTDKDKRIGMGDWWLWKKKKKKNIKDQINSTIPTQLIDN